METHLPRRDFLSTLVGIPVLTQTTLGAADLFDPLLKTRRLKTSLNAYSLNAPLLDGSMDLEDLVDFCAATGFDAVDITGYYFKGYPDVPSDGYLFRVKRKAFSAGLEISGTGVRNDFTIADNNKREKEVALVKKWIEAAAKLGAPVLRIFSGNQKNEGVGRTQVLDWMLKDIQTCVTYGEQHGVIIGIQNHNDFIQTAVDVNEIIESVNSKWLGLILDTGSFRIHDPYEEIANV